MALKKYDVTIRGTRTTLKLSDEDARKMGLDKPAAKAAPKPADKSRSAQNKK